MSISNIIQNITDFAKQLAKTLDFVVIKCPAVFFQFIGDHFRFFYNVFGNGIGAFTEAKPPSLKRYHWGIHIIYFLCGLGILSTLLALPAAIISSFVRHNYFSLTDIMKYLSPPNENESEVKFDSTEGKRNFFGKYFWGGIGGLLGIGLANIYKFFSGQSFVDGFRTLGPVDAKTDEKPFAIFLTSPGRLMGWVIGGVAGFLSLNVVAFRSSVAKEFCFFNDLSLSEEISMDSIWLVFAGILAGEAGLLGGRSWPKKFLGGVGFILGLPVGLVALYGCALFSGICPSYTERIGWSWLFHKPIDDNEKEEDSKDNEPNLGASEGNKVANGSGAKVNVGAVIITWVLLIPLFYLTGYAIGCFIKGAWNSAAKLYKYVQDEGSSWKGSYFDKKKFSWLGAILLGYPIGWIIANVYVLFAPRRGFFDGFHLLAPSKATTDENRISIILTIPGRLLWWPIGAACGLSCNIGLALFFTTVDTFHFLTLNFDNDPDYIFDFTRRNIAGLISGGFLGYGLGWISANIYGIFTGFREGLQTACGELPEGRLLQRLLTPGRWLGGIVGGLFGAIYSTWVSAGRAFEWSYNYFRDKDDKPPEEFSGDDRPWYVKAVGFLGFGYVLGSLVCLFYAFIRETLKSAIEVFQAFINLTLDDKRYPALKMYDRKLRTKILGILGVILGGIPGSFIWLTKGIFLLVRFVFLVAISWIIATYKLIKLPYTRQERFGPVAGSASENANKTINDFKDLYSALNMWGEFVPGKEIKPSQTGGKGIGRFLIEMFTGNHHSETEKLLDKFLASFKEYAVSTQLEEGYTLAQQFVCYKTKAVMNFFSQDSTDFFKSELISKEEREEREHARGIIEKHITKGYLSNELANVPSNSKIYLPVLPAPSSNRHSFFSVVYGEKECEAEFSVDHSAASYVFTVKEDQGFYADNGNEQPDHTIS